MKKTLFLLVLISFIFFNIYGCAPLIVGAACGALGGHALSKDTVQGETDKSYDTLWNLAVAVSRIRGNLQYEDRVKGYIEFKEESSWVYVRLIRLTAATTRLRVSARKHHLPNLALAQDIFVKIMEGVR